MMLWGAFMRPKKLMRCWSFWVGWGREATCEQLINTQLRQRTSKWCNIEHCWEIKEVEMSHGDSIASTSQNIYRVRLTETSSHWLETLAENKSLLNSYCIILMGGSVQGTLHTRINKYSGCLRRTSAVPYVCIMC